MRQRCLSNVYVYRAERGLILRVRAMESANQSVGKVPSLEVTNFASFKRKFITAVSIIQFHFLFKIVRSPVDIYTCFLSFFFFLLMINLFIERYLLT